MSERHKLLLEELARLRRRSSRAGERPEQRGEASGEPAGTRPSASTGASDKAQRSPDSAGAARSRGGA